MIWQLGQSLKPLEKGPISREQLKEYAAASGDHNPIHLDEDFAKAAGYPSVIVHGMLSMAFMGDHLMMNFPTSHYKVRRLKTRFRKVTFPGDVLQCEGEIKRILPEGAFLVGLWTKNQQGDITTEGEAEVVKL